jgi:SAM-dependent methyltransferase
MNRWEELWQTGETPWDKGYAAPPLTEFLERGNTVLHRARQVLVPGCGSGHDVRELARHDIGATGLDLAETAIAAARRYPPVGNETYIGGDLFDSSWRAGLEFDAVWEHTCFCAIDPALRPVYARTMADILSPGAHLVGVFYLIPWDPGEEAAGPPFETSREEVTALLAPWFGLRENYVPARAYPGREGKEWLAVFERVA